MPKKMKSWKNAGAMGGDDDDNHGNYQMKDPCCPSAQRQKCCMKYPRDITESRGFQNLLKCIMKNSPGLNKCDAIRNAKCAYKGFKEWQKVKYRTMECKCPDVTPGCPACGTWVCQKKKKLPCVRCPCDKPRPCPCKLQPPNPCARGRSCDAAEAEYMETSPEEILLDTLQSPLYCTECGGAYLGDVHDDL